MQPSTFPNRTSTPGLILQFKARVLDQTKARVQLARQTGRRQDVQAALSNIRNRQTTLRHRVNSGRLSEPQFVEKIRRLELLKVQLPDQTNAVSNCIRMTRAPLDDRPESPQQSSSPQSSAATDALPALFENFLHTADRAFAEWGAGTLHTSKDSLDSWGSSQLDPLAASKVGDKPSRKLFITRL